MKSLHLKQFQTWVKQTINVEQLSVINIKTFKVAVKD